MNILVTPVLAGKPWNGATYYEQPLGGSEKAVICLSRELARRGHEVYVFASGQPGLFEGVTYHHISQLNMGALPEVDVHISSRWLEVLQHSKAKVRALWLHDMAQMPPSHIPADLIVALSHAQAVSWGIADGGWPEERLAYIGDGVDISHFSGMEVRDPNRMLWISNPDRGLYIACKIFREHILPRWPDLYLDIYGRYAVYGWGKEQERMFLPPPDWIDGKSIRLHEPVPALAVARELMKSWALWYPTWWPETFCMAALEAQAAGTPVVTCPVGALTETVKGGIVTDDLVNAISQLRNRARWEKLAKAGEEWAEEHSWARIAAKWEAKILDIMSLGGES